MLFSKREYETFLTRIFFKGFIILGFYFPTAFALCKAGGKLVGTEGWKKFPLKALREKRNAFGRFLFYIRSPVNGISLS